MVNQKVAARLQVGPNCLLFFIDETGHETFADKNYPVFGLGGCVINSSSAAAVIAEPWRAMKAAHFGGEDVPLHANELRNPTTEQLDALSKFFREQQFARLAVTMSKSAVLPTGKTPLEIITGSMMNRYADLLRRVSPEPNEVAFLHEASNRLDDAIEQHFGGTVAQINGKMIPVNKGLIEKSHGLPELEVADFIMHAAGRRAVQIHRDPAPPFGKDFIVVFQSNPILSSYIHIEECSKDSGHTAVAKGPKSSMRPALPSIHRGSGYCQSRSNSPQGRQK
jgi:Protein of unknown function (DUF3800)